MEIFFDEWTAGTVQSYDSTSKSFSVLLEDGSTETVGIESNDKAHVVLPGQPPLSSPLQLMAAMAKALQDRGVYVRMATVKDAKRLAEISKDFHLEMAKLGRDAQVACLDSKVHFLHGILTFLSLCATESLAK